VSNGSVENRLLALESRLAELEAREAIRNLIAGYGPLADSGNAAAITAMWTENGVYEVGGYGAHTGHAAIAALFTAGTHLDLMRNGCAHLLGPLHIDVDGDRATALGHSCVFRHAGEGFEAWRVSANRWELERRTEGWRVRRRVNRPLDGSEAARALLSLPGATPQTSP
jgi:hypothetical protein